MLFARHGPPPQTSPPGASQNHGAAGKAASTGRARYSCPRGQGARAGVSRRDVQPSDDSCHAIPQQPPTQKADPKRHPAELHARHDDQQRDAAQTTTKSRQDIAHQTSRPVVRKNSLPPAQRDTVAMTRFTHLLGSLSQLAKYSSSWYTATNRVKMGHLHHRRSLTKRVSRES
jgi:hypothetical protein